MFSEEITFDISSCTHDNTLFETISSSHCKIHFKNKIVESDSINEPDVENIYNGGGVGIGDFNNDSQPETNTS